MLECEQANKELSLLPSKSSGLPLSGKGQGESRSCWAPSVGRQDGRWPRKADVVLVDYHSFGIESNVVMSWWWQMCGKSGVQKLFFLKELICVWHSSSFGSVLFFAWNSFFWPNHLLGSTILIFPHKKSTIQTMHEVLEYLKKSNVKRCSIEN